MAIDDQKTSELEETPELDDNQEEHEDKEIPSRKKDLVLLKALQLAAPGTALREAIDHIISAKTGGLIVFGDTQHVLLLCNGGFDINCAFYPQKLYELAKMDGAIILSEDGTKILRANVHLVPNPLIPSIETGIRHRTAERVAKQTKALVISISQRRDMVTIYKDGIRHMLDDIKVVISKSNQALSTLEKYKSRFEAVILNLNGLEMDDTVTLGDVTQAIERAEMLKRVADEIEIYVVELGKEGRLISMQLEELMAGVHEEYVNVVKDYICDIRQLKKVLSRFRDISQDKLLSAEDISSILGYNPDLLDLDSSVHPRGYRMLRKVPRIPIGIVDKVVKNFPDLQSVINATIEELDEVEGIGAVRAKALQEGIRKLKGLQLNDKYI